MKERLQQYALIAEIVGAIAIVISLAFVGLQVQQSNTLASTQSLAQGTQLWLDEYRRNFGSNESTAFMRRALNDYGGLSKDEKGRFYSALLGFVGAFDTIHNQYDAGLMPEEVYISIARGYYSMIGMPGAQRLFDEMDIYLPSYLLMPAQGSSFEDRLAPWPFLEE